jgi:hypothetical protein
MDKLVNYVEKENVSFDYRDKDLEEVLKISSEII